MKQVIVIVGEDGQPLNADSIRSEEELAALSRGGDLMMAFQWGEEAAKGDYPAELKGFELQFAGDAEARAEFEAGVASATTSTSTR